jgi:hypothetical protein
MEGPILGQWCPIEVGASKKPQTSAEWGGQEEPCLVPVEKLPLCQYGAGGGRGPAHLSSPWWGHQVYTGHQISGALSITACCSSSFQDLGI